MIELGIKLIKETLKTLHFVKCGVFCCLKATNTDIFAENAIMFVVKWVF